MGPFAPEFVMAGWQCGQRDVYSVDNLAVTIFGNCTEVTTYFCKDHLDRLHEVLCVTLKAMFEGSLDDIGIIQAVYRMSGTPLFLVVPNEQFWSDIVECEYPLLNLKR